MKPTENERSNKSTVIFDLSALVVSSIVRISLGAYPFERREDTQNSDEYDPNGRHEVYDKLLNVDHARSRYLSTHGVRLRLAITHFRARASLDVYSDDPLSNLDAKLRTQIRTELQELQQRLDVTTIYVTHDQTEAMMMGDRIDVLHEGELQQIGTPLERSEFRPGMPSASRDLSEETTISYINYCILVAVSLQLPSAVRIWGFIPIIHHTI